MARRNYRRELAEMLEQADDRRDIDASEDAAVEALCRRYGYGAVMDAAARLWQREDPSGAFVVGPCRGTLASILKQ